MTTPRVFVVRHGETEWSLDGRHTGTTDIPLTANGEKRIITTGKALVGRDRLIVPSKLAHIYVSPRKRAQRTLELLGLGCKSPVPWKAHGSEHKTTQETNAKIEVTDAIAEWDYGDYEGITSAQIRQQREKAGQPEWDIWHDGCPGGESPAQVTERCDKLIQEIRDKYHNPSIGKDKGGKCPPGDVLIVAHGHILRSFAARWIARDISNNPSMILEAGGVGTLSYEHHNIHEPAILLGGAFMADAVEQAEEEGKEENARSG